MMTDHNDHPTTTDNVQIAVYDAAEVPDLKAARDADPKRAYRTHNVTRVAYHEEVVAGLDGATADLEIDVLVLGDSTTGTDQLSKTSPLGNELFRTSLTDVSLDSQTLSATAFIDSTEANGNSYFEAALVAETPSGDLPINRFQISDALLDPKDQGETVTVTVDITQEDG